MIKLLHVNQSCDHWVPDHDLHYRGSLTPAKISTVGLTQSDRSIPTPLGRRYLRSATKKGWTWQPDTSELKDGWP